MHRDLRRGNRTLTGMANYFASVPLRFFSRVGVGWWRYGGDVGEERSRLDRHGEELVLGDTVRQREEVWSAKEAAPRRRCCGAAVLCPGASQTPALCPGTSPSPFPLRAA
jgi:hypothetical protein